MAFSSTNKLRKKQDDTIKKLKEFPNTIANVNEQIKTIFNSFDSIGKELVNLAMFDIDPSLLDILDNNFKEYKTKKAGLLKTFEDLTRISSSIKDSDDFITTQVTSGGINDTVIDDLQSVLGDINSTLGSDVEKQLEHIKNLQEGLNNINEPVERINDSISVFQKTVDTSFEIFTKSILESMKNSVEMNATLEILENNFNDFTSNIEAQVKSIESSTKSLLNESLANLEVKIAKTIEQQIKQVQLGISTDIEHMITNKVDEINKSFISRSPQTIDKAKEPDKSLSRDRQELNKFKGYMYTWPSSKDELIKKIEEFRDILLVQRANEAPYRVTAMNLFRESLGLLSREDPHLSQETVRKIITIFEKLENVIRSSETSDTIM